MLFAASLSARTACHARASSCSSTPWVLAVWFVRDAAGALRHAGPAHAESGGRRERLRVPPAVPILPRDRPHGCGAAAPGSRHCHADYAGSNSGGGRDRVAHALPGAKRDRMSIPSAIHQRKISRRRARSSFRRDQGLLLRPRIHVGEPPPRVIRYGQLRDAAEMSKSYERWGVTHALLTRTFYEAMQTGEGPLAVSCGGGDDGRLRLLSERRGHFLFEILPVAAPAPRGDALAVACLEGCQTRVGSDAELVLPLAPEHLESVCTSRPSNWVPAWRLNSAMISSCWRRGR